MSTLDERHRRLRVAAVLSAVAALVTMVTVLGGTAFAATLFTDDFEDGNSTGWSSSMPHDPRR